MIKIEGEGNVMTGRTRRPTAVAALALACAAGLLGGGTARAAEVPYTAAGPTALPGGCATGGALPWVGNTDLSLSVDVAGPEDGSLLEARFRLWRAGAETTPVVEVPVSVSAGSTARLQVRREQVPAEGPYWWQARVEGPAGVSAWTAPCGFSTDHTAPADPVVEFLDPRPNNNAAPSGTVRTVRATLPPGTEASYLCLDPQAATGTYACTEGERVPVGADGTATATFVTPERTGPARVWVRAFDRAGNTSSAVSADYWVTSPVPQPFGDHDGDGRPDLLGVDAAGRLTLLAGRAGGGFADPVTADARDWSGALVARAGWLVNRYGPQHANDTRNDLLALRDGKLSAYPGDGAGGFGAPVEVAGYDWSGVTRIAVRPEDYAYPGLLAVEDGRLLYFDLRPGAQGLRVGSPTVLATGGWASKELLVSNAGHGAVLASFWARDAVNGTLEHFGVDYGQQQDPYDLVAPVTVGASGWTGQQSPSVVPVGDLDGDERIDLVTADASGGLALRPVAADGTPGAPVTVPGTVPAGTRLF
ncbi:hypothetical protein [Streptomyces sp. NPDC094049]|uniref:hypothetical protein n=1 Tax=Streptomyces sp. NPDC094049 TaxID=3154987 RepID=UPI003329DB39